MEQISSLRYGLSIGSLILPISMINPRQMTSSDVPSIQPLKGFCGGAFFPAIQTEVGPLTVPTIILFFATFIEAASLSPNRTSIIAVKSPLFKFTVLLPQRQFYCCRNCFRTIFMIRSISSFVFLISLGRQSPLLKISSLTLMPSST